MNSYTRVQGLQQDLYRFNGNEPLLLTDSQTVWVVQLGSFALFAITVASGLPQGRCFPFHQNKRKNSSKL
jgi:hypothetical protein